MKAIEARRLYFEYYVAFEHNVRALARLLFQGKYTTKGKSLSDIIDEIRYFNQKIGNILIHDLRHHRRIRNWLAHSPRSMQVPDKYFTGMKIIQEVNHYIISYIKK